MGKNLQDSSMKVYLSAIRSFHLINGFKDPLLDAPRIPMAIRGLRRVKSITGRPPKSPITALVLHTLKPQLDISKYNDVMFWAACCLAFFGFLRAAEFTTPPEGFCKDIHLSVDSVTIDCFPLPNTVGVKLLRSKTDQFGKGCTIVLARSDCAICPVAALMCYLRLRGPTKGPLFMHEDGAPLTRVNLNIRLQKVLSSAGWQGRYTLHSFRVGAATTAAALGFPEHLIKALGRWNSDAYKVYIRLSAARLQAASRSLASCAMFTDSNAA